MSGFPEKQTSSVAGRDEERVDGANQSLADALSTSFSILKAAMVVLVVLFLASGAFVVEQNEQAIVLRLGKPVGGIRTAGFNWAFPAPIDEVIKVPVKQSSTVAIESHWLHIRDKEKGLPLSQIMRGRKGLHPMRDGALLTGDKGLVHIRWQLTYAVNDLLLFVTHVSDADVEKAGLLITKVLENVAIHIVGGYTTEEATRKRLSELRAEVKMAINETLDRLKTGIIVETVEIPESTPPVQIKLAFDQVIQEENNKRTTIRNAEQMARQLLNAVAGSAHPRLIADLDDRDAAVLAGDTDEVERIDKRIDDILEFEASGMTGSMISMAKGYYSSVVQDIRGDVEEYEALVVEFQERPMLLKSRLWQETKSRLFSSPGVTKIYSPRGSEFRISLGLDPRQRQKAERDEYLKEVERGAPLELEIKYPGGPLTVP